MKKFSLINQNLRQENFEVLKDTLKSRIVDHGCAFTDGEADYVLIAALDSGMKADSFSVEETVGGILVRANDVATVFAAIGRFLVLGKFDNLGDFVPPTLPLAHTMKKPLRGMYFAVHFYNFYHTAPIEEVYEIIADLAYRGYNALMLCQGVQHYTSYKEPAAVEMEERLKKLFAYADLCGMEPSMVLFSNSCFHNYPREFEAQFKQDESGRYKRDLIAEFNTEVCPSTEGGMAEIEREHREFFEAFQGTPIKHFFLWAYDEGGCLCEKCYPWVTNGFMKIAELDRRLIREYGYDAEISISGWHFDVQMDGEWDIFYDHLEKGEYSWAPYVLTSFRSKHPPKVVERKGVPAGAHFIDFPEISMCGIKTWGGYGANPIPMYLDNIEYASGYLHEGGFPYSEGIYEDINKWICAGFYCGYYEHSADAIRDYIRYEFGTEATDDLLRAAQLMESSLPRGIERKEDEPWKFLIRWGTAIPEIYRIVTGADKVLPELRKKNWKWRIFYLRAVIDHEVYRNDAVLKDSEPAQAAFHELNQIFHTEHAKYCVSVPEGK